MAQEKNDGGNREINAELLSPQAMSNKIKTLEFTIGALQENIWTLERQIADLKQMYQFQQREIDNINARYRNKDVERLLGM